MKLSERNNKGAFDYHRKRAENSAKMRLLSMAAIAIQDDPELMRKDFMTRTEVKKLGLNCNTIFNYLVGFPFKKDARSVKIKDDKKPSDIWSAGYKASQDGKKFYQLIGVRNET